MDTRNAKTSVVYPGAIETGKIETLIIFLESRMGNGHVTNTSNKSSRLYCSWEVNVTGRWVEGLLDSRISANVICH